MLVNIILSDMTRIIQQHCENNYNVNCSFLDNCLIKPYNNN